ncbi:hypothetical protein [Sinomonas albida]|nr:hypothetical protein [Sinomonas albida]
MSLFTILAVLMVGAMMVIPVAWEVLSADRRAERAAATCSAGDAESNA